MVVTSTTESEYIACSEGSKEVVWIRQFLCEIEMVNKDPTLLFCDNDGATCLAFDPAFHARVKHLDVRYHYIQERITDGDVFVARVATADNVADIFTKPLSKGPFVKFRSQLGLVSQARL